MNNNNICPRAIWFLGGAVITSPPTNQTKLEGEKVVFTCEARSLPSNVTVRWFREGAPIKEVSSLETRISIKMDGSLEINPVSADDSGQYLCEVSNGIGEPQTASAYLNVECKYTMENANWTAAKLLFSKSSVYPPRGAPFASDWENKAFCRRIITFKKISNSPEIELFFH